MCIRGKPVEFPQNFHIQIANMLQHERSLETRFKDAGIWWFSLQLNFTHRSDLTLVHK